MQHYQRHIIDRRTLKPIERNNSAPRQPAKTQLRTIPNGPRLPAKMPGRAANLQAAH